MDSEESTGNEDIATSAVTDKNGDIIVVGTIFSSRNMYPGQAEVTYISKFSSNGKLYWTQNITGPGGKWAHDVGIDSGDNIIVLGNVWNTIEFLGSEVPSTEGAAFLVKYTNNGEMLNHRIFGGTSFEGGPMGLDIDTEDNIIIAGREGSPGSDFPLKNASDSNYNGGASDVFVAKFSSTLDLIWSTFYGGIGEDGNADTGIVPDIAEVDVSIDGKNNIIITGSSDSPDLYGVQPIHLGVFNVFVTKFNATGIHQWTRLLGGSSNDYSHSVDVDSLDDIIITGKTFSPDFPINLGESDGHNFASIYAVKLNPAGDAKWGRLLGGNADDRGHSIAVDSSDNILIGGRTSSNNIATGSYFGGNDIYVVKLNKNGPVMWEQYYGGEGLDVACKISVDSSNNIVLPGYTDSDQFPSKNSYPFSFGGDLDGVIIKFFANGSIAWSSRAPVVTNPNSDPDSDGLTNEEELNFLTNSYDSDTDDDNMFDLWEIVNGLEPTKYDAGGDLDNDNLSNLLEFQLGTIANNSDTDGDGMLDGWEVEHNLLVKDPNDAMEDSDDDGMHNYWEYIMGLFPQVNDADSDSDNDGMTNLDEYKYSADLGLNETIPYKGLIANNSDSDGDGMSDGWEVDNELNPLEDDANDNKDGDLFPNWVEYELDNSFLRKLNLFSAKDKTDSIIVIVSLIVPIFVLAGYQIRKRRRNKKAISMGFDSFPDYQQSTQAGFKSVEERNEAKNKGFLSIRAQKIIFALGFKNVDQMLDSWNSTLDATKNEFPDEAIEVLENIIVSTISPIALQHVEKDQSPLFEKIEVHLDKLNQIISIQESLILLEKDLDFPQLANFTLEELQSLNDLIVSAKISLEEYRTMIQKLINQQKDWFTPWEPLLSFIQVTEDGLPIELAEIAKIVRSEEKHAEELLELLLNENPVVGTYNSDQKIYTKGVNINYYIKTILSKLEESDLE
ncbi:MAG: SBBP repeat-containing protein [Candidatus Kariarchaeaceae archaeon]